MQQRKKLILLALAAAVAALGLFAGLALEQTVPADNYDTKLDAASRMAACKASIRARKAELGIPLSPEDVHRTGLIGAPMSGITTTAGAEDAKRTAAGDDMAALVVELLTEAGLEPGDRVAAGFSGSFPGLDLAVISACQAMRLELAYISSVGASTYGANQPELTFPDMAWLLAGEGLIPSPGIAFTLGGDMDCGLDMDQAVLAPVRARLEGYGLPVPVIEDYGENIAHRMALYAQGGEIDCFVGVGGNMTTLGRGAEQLPFGLIEGGTLAVNDRSGLLARYNAQGIPVINLLNVRQLVAEYGLPFDPEREAAPGTSAVYYRTVRPVPVTVAALCACAAILLYIRFARRGEDDPWNDEH